MTPGRCKRNGVESNATSVEEPTPKEFPSPKRERNGTRMASRNMQTTTLSLFASPQRRQGRDEMEISPR